VFDIKYLSVGGLLSCVTNHMDENKKLGISE